jgi:ferredoxin
MTLIPIVDEYACSAHGDCLHEAPGAFVLDGGVAEVTGTDADERILAAARACPAAAIVVRDEAASRSIPRTAGASAPAPRKPPARSGR